MSAAYIRKGEARYVFAAWEVERWAETHGGQVPTVEQMQDEPFNFTAEFAAAFMAHALESGWIVEEPDPREHTGDGREERRG